MDAPTPRLIVVAPTYYDDESDVRYALALDSCRSAAKHGIDCILIDASPSQATRDKLEEEGSGFVRVIPQTSKGKKGAALREGIMQAAQTLKRQISSSNNETRRSIIGFQEWEKSDVLRHWKSIALHALESGSDIVVPRRRDAEFRSTYPIEQYHSETFANMLLDCLGEKIGLESMDWLNGPVALDVSMAEIWDAHNGSMWDAQLVPIINAFLDYNAKVSSFEIDYLHPESMKEQEEGNYIFQEKRLYQLNFISDTVGKRMRDAIAERGKENLCG